LKRSTEGVASARKVSATFQHNSVEDSALGISAIIG
jgi:hypothetical protein